MDWAGCRRDWPAQAIALRSDHKRGAIPPRSPALPSPPGTHDARFEYPFSLHYPDHEYWADDGSQFHAQPQRLEVELQRQLHLAGRVGRRTDRPEAAIVNRRV